MPFLHRLLQSVADDKPEFAVMMNSHGCSLKASKLRTQNLLKRFHDLAGCLGCLAHTCALNSWSRCFSYLSVISAIESPMGGPVGLNCHAQAEHAQPRKR